MGFQQAELYQRIQQFSLDAIDANLPFSHRLARDNGWTLDYAQRVIEEYKKFAFLAIVAGHPVTPSDQVDQVWHLHLLYTQSYWNEFCPNGLQTPLHHNPTKGGQQERGKFNDWYSGTLQSYETIFQQLPPADIWSPPHVRFGRELSFVRVNTQQHWILPKPDLSWISQRLHRWLVVLSSLLLFGIAWTSPSWASSTALSTHSIEFSIATFLPAYLWIASTSLSGIITVNLLSRRLNRRFQFGAPLFSSVLFGLFLVGSVRLTAGVTNLPGSEFLGFFVLSAIAGVFADFVLQWWIQTRSLTSMKQKGQDYWRGLPSPRSVQRLAPQLIFVCIVGLYVLGLVRVGLGLYRHQPIGYLTALCLSLAGYLLWRMAKSDLKLSVLKSGIVASIVGLVLLLIFNMPQLIWVLIIVGIWFLPKSSPNRASSGISRTSSSGGTTCVNGDCGGGGSGDSGGDGGCGGCGGCGGE